MFFSNQPEYNKREYRELLKIVGALSNMFSESKTPYLYYRLAEKIFCKAFTARDLSRGDVSVDAQMGQLGIGLKTFAPKSENSFQKIAEFNKDIISYRDLSTLKKIQKISDLRNARLDFTSNLFSLDSLMYHCVVRDEGVYNIYEESMDSIMLGDIDITSDNSKSIMFNDGIHEYKFLHSKSTLFKRFTTDNIIEQIPIAILDDPLEVLRALLGSINENGQHSAKIIQTVYLPLYGSRGNVEERSGLNQWNAKGRKRHPNEVYIPIPIVVRRKVPNFFPDRNTPFQLKLPTGNDLQAKVCQDGGKALMSYSNRELGEWILRDVLRLSEGTLVTNDILQRVGVDSVRIDKLEDGSYEINFAKLGSFDDFIATI